MDPTAKRRQKDRLKTTAVALVLCLNIGVDPPDVIKISPCARLECWVDPMSMQGPKALETIGQPGSIWLLSNGLAAGSRTLNMRMCWAVGQYALVSGC